MFSVIFEVRPRADQWEAYLGYANSGSQLTGWGLNVMTESDAEASALQAARARSVLRKGFEVHYPPSGKPEDDRTRLGLYVAKGPPPRRLETRFAWDEDLLVPGTQMRRHRGRLDELRTVADDREDLHAGLLVDRGGRPVRRSTAPGCALPPPRWCAR